MHTPSPSCSSMLRIRIEVLDNKSLYAWFCCGSCMRTIRRNARSIGMNDLNKLLKIRSAGRIKPSLFPVQNDLFTCDPPTVAAYCPVCTDHAVTGYQKSYRITAHGPAYRPGCMGMSYPCCQLTVTDGFTERDTEQCLPDPELKIRALHEKRYRSRTQHIIAW